MVAPAEGPLRLECTSRDPVPTAVLQDSSTGRQRGDGFDLSRGFRGDIGTVWVSDISRVHTAELRESVVNPPPHSNARLALEGLSGGRFTPQEIRLRASVEIKRRNGLLEIASVAPLTTESAAMVESYLQSVETSCFKDEIKAAWDLSGELIEGGPDPGAHWALHQEDCEPCRSLPAWPQYRQRNHINPCWFRVPMAWLGTGYFPAFQREPDEQVCSNSRSLSVSPIGVARELANMARDGISETGEVVTVNPLTLVNKDIEVYRAASVLRQVDAAGFSEERAKCSDYLNASLARQKEQGLLPAGAITKVKDRICADASRTLNPNLPEWPLRYHTVMDVVKALPEGGYMAKIDLKACFLQLRLHRRVRKYYGFRVGAELRRFASMIFGTTDAPAMCNTLTGIVAGFLRARGVRVIVMTDDFCIVAATREECGQHYQLALRLLDQLRWAYGLDKLVEPCQCLDFLGVEINAVERTLSIRADRVEIERQRLEEALSHPQGPMRKEVEMLAGRLNWLVTVCPRGRPFVSGVYAMLGGGGHPLARMQWPEETRRDLEWWLKILESGAASDRGLWTRMYEADACEVVRGISDASPGWGFGVVSSRGVLQGRWGRSFSTGDSTYLELLALWGYLHFMGNRLGGTVFLFTTDNSSTALAINKGTAPDVRLRLVLKAVAAVADECRCVVVADHVVRRYMSVPDALSRGVPYAQLCDRPLRFAET